MRYESHRFHDAYLQIQIKDRGFLGNGLFLGEAFLPLNELRLGDLDQRLSDLPQIQLPLSKPSGFGEKTFFKWKEIFDFLNPIFSPKILMWCWLWIPDILIKLPSNFCRKKNESCEKKTTDAPDEEFLLLYKNPIFLWSILNFPHQSKRAT